MVAIRPTAVQGTAGQKFVVMKRFSGDGFDFVIGDVIVARDEWVHKIPMLVDQRFISPFLTAEDEQKTPINLELPKVKEVKESKGKTTASAEISDSEVNALAASLS